MRIPPRWLRRVVFAPLLVVATAFVIGLEPLWLIVALALTSLVPGRFRLPRVVLLATVYLLWDTALVVVLFVLWIASGFGWKLRSPAFLRAHYRVGAWALRALFWVFGGVLRLDIVTTGSDDPDAAAAHADFQALLSPGAPLVLAARHGGPGDSFILVHTLLNAVDREPRIVLKDTLQWDPGIDILLNRLPTRFITPSGFGAKRAGGGVGVEERIADLATGLDDDDALVIFPEGGQVSAKRRRSRIERLRTSGRIELAQRARALRHVMPPQPGGVHAALDAAPDADMVFIGHTGLDRLLTLGDIWRELPMDKRITMHAWRVPHAEIPQGRDAQAEWLFAWFERIDAWIEEHNPLDA
ncbi:1-acyl-sn-glycerol-3-phosphate acyltransferase [Microbacterium ulmi]|uniref:1-acyl-sn-glycerol-3-phosphate acyltransferase n=1 Tax=Microbacterium ulmi TaxID=179095 RepID=A0A7Y2M4E3_9MICO|nr:1-acyl-sn-glycerol-3-phosphate acyltransferase [Microbacterium ulmi]NII69506.1 1-acyl-sn-glycerol-3-phosphate acyltransferase [Microbacterium ulmi]NNH04893.1 1-acyl-sn-glycerol-3-phosphate acyltransferase [Microbacterium ulmi]